jgi:hypothetical protein
LSWRCSCPDSIWGRPQQPWSRKSPREKQIVLIFKIDYKGFLCLQTSISFASKLFINCFPNIFLQISPKNTNEFNKFNKFNKFKHRMEPRNLTIQWRTLNR